MKKLFLSLSAIFCFTVLSAQTDSLLQQYTGKYVFPEGSPVREIGVALENNILTATSAAGNSELKKTDTKDVFEVVAYAGTATFKRNPEGKVNGVLIQVQDVNMEGTKTEDAYTRLWLRKTEQGSL
ncbi:MAG: hypothetical protein HYZ15_02320 [Sphingobacteriales bacterium]|nr:hypothetical protein [Sphingobacteriales bacterium]